MIITIKVLGGKDIVMDTPRVTPVSEVNERVQEVTSIPASQQRLIFNGTTLDPTKTLWDHRVPHGAAIILVKSTADRTTPATSSSDTDVARENDRDDGIKLVADAGEIDPDTGELKMRKPEDFAPQLANIPWTCAWRLSAVFRLAAGRGLEALVLRGWAVPGLRAEAPAGFVILKMVDGLLEKVESEWECPDEGTVVVKPVESGVLGEGVFTLAAVASGQECEVCKKADDDEHMLVCDDCHKMTHMQCLEPPLTEVPEDDWYCAECSKEKRQEAEARAEAERKAEEKKKKMPSATCKKKWGGGVSCVGRRKTCTVVPVDHKGRIPGVPVGKHWRLRVEASEAGVHRPLVGGMHGAAKKGCYSIVISGGYEDDEDNGDEVTYTGSGGRDLSGNKRQAKQSTDQVLTGPNAGLALGCVAHKKCKDCTDEHACERCLGRWREGQPVRVLRSYKGHSIYAPKAGVRYDGIYKVVDYWLEAGAGGFRVWRFRLRREDDEPAPWTQAGHKRIIDEKLDELSPADGKETPTPDDEKSSEDSDGRSSNGNKRKSSSGSRKSDSDERENDQDEPNKKKGRTHHHHSHRSHHHKSDSESESDSDSESGSESDSSEEKRKGKKKAEKRRQSTKQQEKKSSKDDSSSSSDEGEPKKKRSPRDRRSSDDQASGDSPRSWKVAAQEYLKQCRAKDQKQNELCGVFRNLEDALAACRSEDDLRPRFMDLLRCPICISDELAPSVILPCGHHVCTKCLVRLIRENDSRCPNCRGVIPDSKYTPNALFREICQHFLPYAMTK